MPYVSAHYMPPDPLALPDAPKQVSATDAEGVVWSLTEDSQVGDWLRYLEDGGTIDPIPVHMQALPAPEPPRDLEAEIDALDARVTALEGSAARSKPVTKAASRGKKK